MKWLSTYLFLEGDYNFFLSNELDPFVQSLEDKGILAKFFFIRYYENGKHIRLRLCPHLNSISLLTEELSYWLKELEQKTEDQYELLRWESVSYIPETERYGGEVALPICESFFCESSKMVLKLIKTTAFDYSAALLFSIQLNLTFLKACKVPVSEQQALWKIIMHGWLSTANELLVYSQSGHDNSNDVLVFFEQSYEKQRETFLQIKEETDELGQTHTEDHWYPFWEKSVCTLDIKLKELLDCNIEAECTSLYNIYLSLIHMTNNRLGLQNHDEAFLGYVKSKLVN